MFGRTEEHKGRSLKWDWDEGGGENEEKEDGSGGRMKKEADKRRG
jgi:hypothetical protein